MSNSFERKMLRQLDDIKEASEADKESRRIASQTVDEYKAEKNNEQPKKDKK